MSDVPLFQGGRVWSNKYASVSCGGTGVILAPIERVSREKARGRQTDVPVILPDAVLLENFKLFSLARQVKKSKIR